MRSFLDLARRISNIRVRATDFGLALNGGNENGDQEESCKEEEEEHQEEEEALIFSSRSSDLTKPWAEKPGAFAFLEPKMA